MKTAKKTKTNLGVTVELLGAAMYFTGLINIVPLVLMAGYALLMENDEWLKKTAVKAVGIVIIFSVLYTLVGLLDDPFSLISRLLRLFKVVFTYSWLSTFISICQTIISLVQNLLLLLLGFSALGKGDVRLGSVDNVIEKNM